jgi:hypothetical protein
MIYMTKFAEFVFLVEKDELLLSLCSSVIFGVDVVIAIVIVIAVIEWLCGVNQEHVNDRGSKE